MKEKLLIFVSACLCVTLVMCLVFGREEKALEELDADVMAYNSDTEPPPAFSEVRNNLDDFVQNCGTEQGIEQGVADSEDVIIETTVKAVEVKDAVAITAAPETTAVTTTVTPKVTTKPVVTTTKRVETTTTLLETTASMTTPTKPVETKVSTTVEETATETVSVEFGEDEEWDFIEETEIGEEEEATEEYTGYWTTTAGE